MTLALASLFLMMTAALGLGTAILKGLGLLPLMRTGERLPMAFAVGFCGIGVIWFPLFQALGPNVPLHAGCLVLCACGLFGVKTGGKGPAPAGRGWMLTALAIAVLLIAFGLDLAEAIVPPSDADSTSYHFVLPKRFWEAGVITFEPIAVNAAIPLLVHMTYLPAYGLGGELGLTLWCGTVGWMVAWLFYALARRHLERGPALVATALLATTPAVIYGAGTGQVEVKSILFTLPLVLALPGALRAQSPRDALAWALLAGFLAGGFAASKYTGLFWVAAAGTVITLGRPLPLSLAAGRAIAFGLGALVSGATWYAWNYVHTGDPLFPSLYGLLPYLPETHWNDFLAAGLEERLIAPGGAVPRTLWGLIGYPLIILLSSPGPNDAGRTGLGPVMWLALPWLIAGFWIFRDRIVRHPLLPALVAALLFYGLWYNLGIQQKVRHFLALYPIGLLVVAVLITRLSIRPALAATKPALFGGLLFALTAQLAAHGLITLGPIRYLFGTLDRESYLETVVPQFGLVDRLNKDLDVNDRVIFDVRPIRYFLERPQLYADPDFQGRLLLSAKAPEDTDLFLNQARAAGATHVLVEWPIIADNFEHKESRLVRLLLGADPACFGPGTETVVRDLGSRTESLAGRYSPFTYYLYAFRWDHCRPGAKDDGNP
ncbi:MAG: ArnT family glycosyltransferase [Rhodospirillales bacterium]